MILIQGMCYSPHFQMHKFVSFVPAGPPYNIEKLEIEPGNEGLATSLYITCNNLTGHFCGWNISVSCANVKLK